MAAEVPSPLKWCTVARAALTQLFSSLFAVHYTVYTFLVNVMGSLTQWGVFVPGFSQPMTRRFERLMVGARHVADGA